MPHGPGPHPTPEESARKADEFDRAYDRSAERQTDPELPAGDDMHGGNFLITPEGDDR